MSTPIKLVDLVDTRIASFLDQRSGEMAAISGDLDHVADYVRGLLGTGKRFRARFCYWGWRSAHATGVMDDESGGIETLEDLDGVLSLAVSLEIFHAAALVHDDIMDNSDTRRGQPAAHRYFEAIHRERGFAGDAAHFGVSTALLVGDLLLAWSDDLLTKALRGAPEEVAQSTRY